MIEFVNGMVGIPIELEAIEKYAAAYPSDRAVKPRELEETIFRRYI